MAALVSFAVLVVPGICVADPAAQAGNARVAAALQNIRNLERPGQEGYATIWDGNKYVQCGLLPDRSLRCEAAGALMQPSLARVLVPERIGRLAALGWNLDPSFGNYVRTFPSDIPTAQLADEIEQALAQGYDAQLSDLEVMSAWLKRERCPPRHGPGQNLAGMVGDAPGMAVFAVHACTYQPLPGLAVPGPALSTQALIARYGPRVTGEIQRLLINSDRKVFLILETGIGYVQCRPEPLPPPPVLYCEAESADNWPALASVLTPDHVARLHAAGWADPGRTPNYSKAYPLPTLAPAALATELLTLLHDVYGYTGAAELKVKTD